MQLVDGPSNKKDRDGKLGIAQQKQAVRAITISEQSVARIDEWERNGGNRRFK